MGAVQIAPVAHRADIAAGTVYRYFPSKNNLIAEVASAAGRTRSHAGGADGRRALSALASCIAARALNDRRLTGPVLAEPVDC
jgi:AcrR family transcriptional regulator